MRRLLLASVILTVALCPATAEARRPTGKTPVRVTPAAIRSAMHSVWKRNRGIAPGACMGAIDKRVRVIRCFGSKDPANGAGAPNHRTLFAIGSITKTVTGTLLALRATQPSSGVKIIDVARAPKYWPSGDHPGNVPQQLSLRDLGQHYSGLPDIPLSAVGSYDDLLTQAADCYAATNCLIGPDKAQWSYSNWGIDVLGTLLARHDGYTTQYDPWAQDVADNITAPLGMKDTHTWEVWSSFSGGTPFGLRKARGYLPASGGGFTPAPSETLPYRPYENAAGALWSTPDDMMRWMQYSRGVKGTPALRAADKVLRSHSWWRKGSVAPGFGAPSQQGQAGFGWAFGPGPPVMIGKNGSLGGFASYMTFRADKKPLGVFVMLNVQYPTNGQANHPGMKVGCALLRALPPKRSAFPCAPGL